MPLFTPSLLIQAIAKFSLAIPALGTPEVDIVWLGLSCNLLSILVDIAAATIAQRG